MDWCTPDDVLERVRFVGGISLDPCTTLENPCNASVFYALERGQDGLLLDWHTGGSGLAYVNPPYGRTLPLWVAKAMREANDLREVILLVPARTDTRWWGWAFDACQSVALWRGRLTFRGAPAPSPFPSCLFYFGDRARAFKRSFADRARVLPGGKP
jgi:site-specific DNA-methyltransferase (adenine-specific)